MRILSLVLLVMLMGCANMYTKVDPVNMKRFEHDQKVVKGMTKMEVLDLFGSPDVAYARSYGFEWRYYQNIFCGNDGQVCSFYFNEDEKLNDSYNIRMEFNNTVK